MDGPDRLLALKTLTDRQKQVVLCGIRACFRGLFDTSAVSNDVDAVVHRTFASYLLLLMAVTVRPRGTRSDANVFKKQTQPVSYCHCLNTFASWLWRLVRVRIISTPVIRLAFVKYNWFFQQCQRG